MSESHLQVLLYTCCTGCCFKFNLQRFHSLAELSLSNIQLHYVDVKALLLQKQNKQTKKNNNIQTNFSIKGPCSGQVDLPSQQQTQTMSQKKVNNRHVAHKKDKPRDSEGTKRPLTSLLWGDVPSVMSQLYSWKGQQAHKVKPTWSQLYSTSKTSPAPAMVPLSRVENSSTNPTTTRSHSCEEDRGQLDVHILIVASC